LASPNYSAQKEKKSNHKKTWRSERESVYWRIL